MKNIKNTKVLALNYITQIVAVAIILYFFKTTNNMLLNFSLTYTGFYAAVLHQITIWVYLALQIITFIVAYATDWKKPIIILFFAILSTFLLGWVSIFNSIAIVYIIARKTSK